MTSRPGDGTGALEKAIDLLEEIAREPGGVTHGDIAESLGMPRTTVYRLLATLTARGLARHDAQRRVYTLGARYVELTRQTYAMPDLVAAATQELRDLRDLTGETSYVGTLEGNAVVSLEQMNGSHSHRSNAGLGHRKPIYATSQGKAILAALDAETRTALIEHVNLAARTAHTLTTRRRLNADIKMIQSRGWAIDDEENVMGVRCVGAAIVDPQGVVRGAISVAGPGYRLPLSRLELLGPELVDAARRIGSRLESTGANSIASDVTPVAAASALYGAFPVWDARHDRLIWADALGPALRIHDDKAGDRPLLRLERPVMGIHAMGEGVRVLYEDGAVDVDAAGTVTPLPEWRMAGVQSLAMHPDGTPWAALAAAAGGAVLGTVSDDGRFRRQWSFGEPVHAMAWAADGQCLFVCAPDSGSIYQLRQGSERVQRVATVPRGAGLLGGIACDPDGGLWVTLRGGWSVMHLRRDGTFERSIPLPVPYPTGVAVAGNNGDRLYITSARQPVAPDVLRSAPLSGRLFCVSRR